MRNKFSNYNINKDGSLYRISSGRIMTNRPKKGLGYVQYSITNDSGEKQDVYAHRLVASEYLGLDLSDTKRQVDHINGIKHDNRVENLRLCSAVENVNWGKLRTNKLPYYITKVRLPNTIQGYGYRYTRYINNKYIVLKTSINLDKVISFKKEYESK